MQVHEPSDIIDISKLRGGIYVKRFLLTLSICLLCLFAWNLTEASAITIEVDGVTLQSDTAPEIVNGRTFVPLRVIFEALNTDVIWYPETQGVATSRGGKYFQLFIGKNIAYINGKETPVDEPAYISNGRTMVPVRFIAETLNCKVDWDNNTRTVKINTKRDIIFENEYDFTLLIDGKAVDFGGKAKLHSYQWEKDEGIMDYLIVPFEPFVKAITPMSEIKKDNNRLTLRTNTDVYISYDSGSPIHPIYGNTLPVESCRFYDEINGELYVDARYIAELLGADYEFNADSKTIKITTIMEKVKTLKDKPNYFIVNNYDEIGNYVREFLFTDVSAIDKLHFYPNYLIEYPDDLYNPYHPVIRYLDTVKGGEFSDVTKILIPVSSYQHFKNNENEMGFITVNIEHRYYKDDKEPMNVLVNKKINKIVSDLIKPNMTDTEKIKVLHDYVAKNTNYDYANAKFNVFHYERDNYLEHERIVARNSYGSLILGKGICIAYAEGLYRLLDKVGIEVRLIGGDVDGEPHAWVAVKQNNQWFHLDPTFNSTGNTDKYFMLTESEIRKTHKW